MDSVSHSLLNTSSTAYLMVSCCLLTLLMLLHELKQKVIASSDVYQALRELAASALALFIRNDTEVASAEVAPASNAEQDSLLQRAPGPRNYPIIGALKELNGYEVPYQAFSEFGKRYGPVTALRLGSVNAVVVNGIETIKEVLINRVQHFDSRPNFRRYQLLFSGNKENSLAFCDWSELQKARRDMLVPHTFPRNFSGRFHELNDIVVDEIGQIMGGVGREATVAIKPLVLGICANVFAQYFGSYRFEAQDPRFQQLLGNFDQIFWEVNQGYAADFLPFLLPLHRQNLKRMDRLAEEIRHVILETIIGDRYERWTEGSEPRDYVDSLIDHVKSKCGPALEWETALYALEDIIGGHSAVGNFLVKAFGYIVQHPEVQQRIQAEADGVLERHGKQMIELHDRTEMPYTEAVIMEALRLIASPIVPHVANQDSHIGGYAVEKDTLIFLNNYDLSMSPELWDAPERFTPERFLQGGRLVKPDHFIPFGAGRRSCMGYRMTQLLSFSILANLLRSYTIGPVEGQDYRVPVGSLAMPEQSYTFTVMPRCC
ncbi:cytochrome P450 307a1-like [Anopheles darlingi]|uniref:cytochrome P450 307a1-like n=1 Tax=Anopheles darlingi TaxID=43151 RepID=UPI0020FFF8B0|nr:cytochrome P450 307a1-like [Anopheles darlingi]